MHITRTYTYIYTVCIYIYMYVCMYVLTVCIYIYSGLHPANKVQWPELNCGNRLEWSDCATNAAHWASCLPALSWSIQPWFASNRGWPLSDKNDAEWSIIYIYTLYKFLKYIYIYIMDQKRTTNTSKYWVYTSASINSFSSVMSWIVIARQCTTIWHTKARGRVIKSTVKGFQPFNTDAFLPQYPEQVVLAVPPDQHTPTFSVHTII